MKSIDLLSDSNLHFRIADALGDSNCPTWNGAVEKAYNRLVDLGQSFDRQPVNLAMIEEMEELAETLDRILTTGSDHGELLLDASKELRRRASNFRSGLLDQEQTPSDLVIINETGCSANVPGIIFLDPTTKRTRNSFQETMQSVSGVWLVGGSLSGLGFID